MGRHAEAALVGLTLGQAQGAATAVILRGEPGIGKTRLLSEAVTRAVANGARVIAVRANSLESRVPFGAVTVALDRAAAADPSIADAATAMHEFVGGVDGDARLSFAQLCDVFTRMLLDLARQAPASVVVDDLHLLDHESVALLAVVLGRVETADVSFVCSTRSSGRDFDAHGAELLGQLRDWADVEELNLGPLGHEEVHEVLGEVFGGEVTRDIAELVHRRSGGNPLFVLEMARSVSDLELLPQDLPEIVHTKGELHLTRHTAVLQRLFPLSPKCRRVAQAIAVLDRVTLDDLPLIADVIKTDQAAVAAAFDDLERRGIVVSDAGHSWALFHPFVGDALYDDIGPAERRRIHGLVAEHLESRRTRGEPVDLNRLAWHAAESATVGDERAARILHDAADAIRTTGPVSAADLCQRALALLPEPSPLRTELLSLRVRCLTLAGRPQEAVDAGLAALAAMDRGEERARVADGVIAGLFDAGRVEEARRLADAEVAAGDASAFLLAHRAMLLAAEADASAAECALPQVLATPARSTGEAVLVHAFVASTYAALGRVSEALHHFDRVHELVETARPSMKVYGITRRCWSLAVLGCLDQALPALVEAEAVVADMGPGVHARGVQASRIAVDWMSGRWDAAMNGAATVRRALEMSTFIRRYLQNMEIEIRTARGELREALALVNQPIPGASVTMAAWATSGALLAAGDVSGARGRLRAACERPSDRAWLPHLLTRLVELEHAAGNADAATEAMRRLEAAAQPENDPRPWVESMRLRCRALVNGDVESAHESARVAAADGNVYAAAQAQLVVGMLDPADTECVLAAHDTFGVLGADAERRRAAALLRERGAKVPRRRRTTPGQLTSAEMQIARLVQSGMRNREIARTANYSERTVEVYLSRIYAKLGVSSRLQLARLLDEQGQPDAADEEV